LPVVVDSREVGSPGADPVQPRLDVLKLLSLKRGAQDAEARAKARTELTIEAAIGHCSNGDTEGLSVEVRLDEARVGEVRPIKPRDGEVRAGQVRPAEVRLAEFRPAEVRALAEPAEQSAP
jgi:hypothetical protein